MIEFTIFIPAMGKDNIKAIRNSRMELNHVYFWTNTIKDWKHLLKKEAYKSIIIDQLKWLVNREKVAIYGYVIMDNHIHLLWEPIQMNGEEMPHASLNKWTSSNFLKDLRINHPNDLHYFVEVSKERNHRFWQRDPLAVLMDCKSKFEQKLDYIHLNPLGERWNLVKSPIEYRWSSAAFYETGEDEFDILTHYINRYEGIGDCMGLWPVRGQAREEACLSQAKT